MAVVCNRDGFFFLNGRFANTKDRAESPDNVSSSGWAYISHSKVLPRRASRGLRGVVRQEAGRPLQRSVCAPALRPPLPNPILHPVTAPRPVIVPDNLQKEKRLPVFFAVRTARPRTAHVANG